MRHSAGPTALLRILVIVFLPLTASPAAGEPVLIDFEMLDAMDFWSGQPIPEAARLSDELATTHGVLFSSGAGYVAVVALGVGHATSGTNGIGGSTPAGIHRVEFLGTQDDCGVGLDDLTFNPVIPIPTPTTSRTWGRVKAAHR
jgi:hypothetical protein